MPAHHTRRQLKKIFPRKTPVREIQTGRVGIVTGYGRESVNPGTVRVCFDCTTTSRLVSSDNLVIVVP